jgi:hypothetical protein
MKKLFVLFFVVGLSLPLIGQQLVWQGNEQSVQTPNVIQTLDAAQPVGNFLHVTLSMTDNGKTLFINNLERFYKPMQVNFWKRKYISLFDNSPVWDAKYIMPNKFWHPVVEAIPTLTLRVADTKTIRSQIKI